MYKCKHFKIYELVPPNIWHKLGENAWLLFDDRALMTLDQLRGQFRSITVNDWHWGGSRTLRGFRTADSTVGALHSQHKYGRAMDCSFKYTTSEIVREYILGHQGEFLDIGGIELSVKWLHFDTRNKKTDEDIFTFNPA